MFRRKYEMELFFGLPGSGKTTKMASIVKKDMAKKRLVRYLPFLKPFVRVFTVIYCTDPDIKNTVHITYDMLGRFKPTPNSAFLLCEAGAYLSNRLTFSPKLAKAQEFATQFRHDKCNVYMDSQTVDVDIKFRQRCSRMWIVKADPVRPDITHLRRVHFDIDVNDEEKVIAEQYTIPRGPFGYLFSLLTGGVQKLNRRKYYDYFDTYSDNNREFDLEDPAKAFLAKMGCHTSR